MTGSRPVAARTQCRRMIWEIATWVSALLSITAVLFSFLTDESIQLHVTCALVLGVIPAAAVLLLAAVLVSLLSFLGTVYDFLRAALAHGLVSCISLLRAILVRSVNLHEPHMNRVLVQAAGQLVRSTMAGVIWTRHLLRRAAGGARNGWTFVVREVVLEALWTKHLAGRLIEIIPFMAAWPIRTSARLLLRFMDWKRSNFESLRAPISLTFARRTELSLPSRYRQSTQAFFHGCESPANVLQVGVRVAELDSIRENPFGRYC